MQLHANVLPIRIEFSLNLFLEQAMKIIANDHFHQLMDQILMEL